MTIQCREAGYTAAEASPFGFNGGYYYMNIGI